MASLNAENLSPSTPIRDWAASTTAAWANEVKTEMKLERRRACIARCRLNTKHNLQHMRQERTRLEEQVKQFLAVLSNEERKTSESSHKTREALYRLALESDALRTAATGLFDRLQQQERFQSLVQEAAMDFRISTESTSVREASKMSKWVLSNEPSWQVSFPSGESFDFLPFTPGQFNSILQHCDDALALEAPPIEVTGSLMGWTVHRAPFTRREDGSIVPHVRFTMRISCTLDAVDKIIVTSNLDSWPLIWTPPDWAFNERKQASCHVLQEFAPDAYVLAHDIPGRVHSRYISLARRLPRRRHRFVKRAVTYAMVIVDPETNTRGHSTQLQKNVQWINEGGSYIKCTEVDANTIDICYDHWAKCHDERHAHHLFIRWAEFATTWSQKMSPSNLLRP